MALEKHPCKFLSEVEHEVKVLFLKLLFLLKSLVLHVNGLKHIPWWAIF